MHNFSRLDKLAISKVLSKKAIKYNPSRLTLEQAIATLIEKKMFFETLAYIFLT